MKNTKKRRKAPIIKGFRRFFVAGYNQTVFSFVRLFSGIFSVATQQKEYSAGFGRRSKKHSVITRIFSVAARFFARSRF